MIDLNRKRGSCVSKKTCFFVTPIGDTNSEQYKRSDKVLKNILEPVLSNEFEVVRVDKINVSDNINQTIINHLENSELVIIDMTDHNPNVFYEFGYRHASDKPLIPIKFKDSDKIPFDVASLRTILYSFDIDDVNDAKTRLAETVNAFDFSKTSERVVAQEPTVSESIQLLKINDKLDVILESINARNEDEINTVASVMSKYGVAQKTPENAILESILPMIMNDPSKFQTLMQIAEMANQQNSDLL